MSAGKNYERLLQQVLCGDLDENDPRVRTVLDADPRWREELEALRTAERQWTSLAADAAEIRATATADISPVDRAQVHAALAPRRRAVPVGKLAWLLAAAAVLAIWLVGPRQKRPAHDGVLGGVAAVLVERVGDTIAVHVREQLPPGGSYHLRLEVAGRAPLSAVSDAADFTFPAAWNLALAAATSARLVVECGDEGGLSIVHSVQLK